VSSETSFDKMAEALGLAPDQYVHSAALREWVERNKDEKYVPSYLLKAWGLIADDAA